MAKIHLLLVVLLFTGSTLADEANCDYRTSIVYESSICNVPYGGVNSGDNESDIPPSFNLTKCQSDSNNGGTNTLLLGILVSLLAAASFGSQFIPTKKFDTGDGMYFQWMMAIGAWIVGLIVNTCLGSQPPFISFSMLSGFLWASGNVFSVPSFYFIGIGIGQTMQGNLNLLGGWITGRFILCSHIGKPTANTIGVVLVIISTVLLSFVKVDTTKKRKSHFVCCKKLWYKVFKANGEDKPLLPDKNSVSSVNSDMSVTVKDNDDDSEQDDVATTQQSLIRKLQQTKFTGKLIGLSFAIFSGVLLGFQYLPIEILKRCEDDVFSCDGLNYSFGMFSGIFITSTFWFLVYCVFMKFKPKINHKLTVPALLSGVMYGIGNVCWLLSNQFVGLPISFPIITSGASIVSCTWGVLVFQEITGWKNLGLFSFAFVFVVVGIITVGISHS